MGAHHRRRTMAIGSEADSGLFDYLYPLNPLGTCWVQAQLALRGWFYGCNHMAVHPLAQALSMLALLGQVPPVGSERQRSAAQHPSSERPYYVPAHPLMLDTKISV